MLRFALLLTLFISRKRKESNTKTFKVKKRTRKSRMLSVGLLRCSVLAVVFATTAAATAATATTATTTAAGKDFYQIACADSSCKENCQTNAFPQNTCLLAVGGGSVECECSGQFLFQRVYLFTTDCTAYHYNHSAKLNTCVSTDSNDFCEFMCPSGGSPPPPRRGVRPPLPVPFRTPMVYAPRERGVHLPLLSLRTLTEESHVYTYGGEMEIVIRPPAPPRHRRPDVRRLTSIAAAFAEGLALAPVDIIVQPYVGQKHVAASDIFARTTVATLARVLWLTLQPDGNVKLLVHWKELQNVALGPNSSMRSRGANATGVLLTVRREDLRTDFVSLVF